MLRLVLLVGAFICCPVLASRSQAEPPSLTHFQPAGVQRGTTRTIECVGKFNWPIQIDCPGAAAECLEEKGKLQITVDADLASDRIWIRLFDQSGASAAMPLLVDELPSVDEVEPNNDPGKAQTISASAGSSVGVIVDGVLETNGDVDGFAVQLDAGQTLVAVVNANTAFGAPMDAILQIALSDGTVVGENHDFRGFDPGLSFTAKQSGTYVVRLFAWPSNPNQSIRYHGAANFIYRLTLTTGPYITHAVDQVATAAEPVGVAGLNVSQSMTGIAQPLQLSAHFDEVEPLGAVTDGSVGFVRIPGVAGSARLRLLDADSNVTPITLDDRSPTPLTIDSVASAVLDQPGGKHVYSLALRKDQTAQIVLESVSLHSELVPKVQLFDPSGKVVAETSERGAAVDGKLSFKATLDGEYRLEVRDRFGAGSLRHFYRLSLIEPPSDFQVSLAADRFTATRNQPLEIPVTISRVTGLGEPIGDIELTVEGLPAGTQTQPVVSVGNNDSAKKVTLKLTTDGQPFSGPIRIVGTSGEIRRIARTPASFGASFQSVWLTVVAAE